MRSLPRLFIAVSCLVFLSGPLSAQNGFNTGLNGTVVNLPCNQNCVTRSFQIPHLKTTSDYAVNTIAYAPFPYTTAGGSVDVNLYNDDTYSTLIDIPFSFCFYDSVFTKVVVGSNGLLTFDAANAGCANAYTVTQPIPFNGGVICNLNSLYYPNAAIMGVFSDLDPRAIASPVDRKIEWRVEGAAPYRRFVVSYYHVGVYSASTACSLATPNTFQMVIYESTGLVEIFIEQKACFASTSSGRAILGVQNWNRDKGVAAPGKNSSVWSENNTAYRFTPSGAVSRYVSCQLQTLAGTLITTGDTITTAPGLLDVTFPNFCPAAATGQYVIKTTYSACDIPANQIIVLDTITVNKTNALNATVAVTPTACGVTGTGTVTVTVPPGVGTAPYTYVLTPGNISQTTNVFTALTAGNYTITVTDNSGGCSSVLPITITSTGVLALTFNIVNTSCPGANNGSITVNPPNGTPPITYSINGNLPGINNVFSGLIAGTYFITVQDNAGCSATFVPVTVNQGTGTVTGTAVSVPPACTGALNGSITVTPTSGTGPYQYSINGGPYQSSNVFTGLATGNYTVTIKEAGLCISAGIPVTVGAGAALLANAVAANTSCAGAADGTVTVTPTNGSSPYTFILDGTVTQAGATTVFNNVAAGVHSIIVRDASGCQSAPIPVTVVAGPVLTGTATATTATCPGVNNATITATATNGTGPYTYALDGGAQQAANTFINVAAGAHNIVIRTATGCISANIPVAVTAGAGLTATLTPTSTTCTGVNNGSITVTPTNGSGPYTFVLDGTTTQTGAIANFTGVSTGAHNVSITDAIGCTTTAPLPVTVTAGGGFIASYTSVNSSCTGAANGSITVTAGTGGTGPYTFVLGATTQTGATNTTFTNLTSGTYSILITDANGCQFTLNPAIVTASAGFTASYTSTNSSCTGAANGSLTITPGTGGTGPYTFVLGATMQTGATNTTFTNLTSGTYSILITDANGCQFTLSPATVTASVGFTASYTSTATSCSGAANGSITVTPGAGGAGPYTFVLGATTQTGATNTIFNNLAAGQHNILITDANGCQFTLNNANVTAGAPLAAVITAVATACPGVSNGSIIITPSNGNGPYIFILDGTVTQTGVVATTFTGVAAGAHTIAVTDVNGCNSILPPVNIVSGTGITANINPVGTSCTGAINGSIAITPTNGTAPYTFILNGTTTQTGATTTSFANLAAGNGYSIVVTDAIGCTGTFSNINVPQGSALLAIAVPSATTCNGAANGQITVTPTNGAGPYTFLLNGTTTQIGATNTVFTGLAANTYSVVVRDGAGCQSSPIPVTVNPGASITVTPAKVDATCFGSANGSITATPSANATMPLQYSLDNITWQASPNFNGLVANTYTVYIRDAVGCTNSAAITVGQPTQLAAATSVQNVLCNSQTNGVITVNATGGITAYSYSLNNITYQPGNTFTVGAGPYTIYVKDAKNCIVQVSNVTVTQPAILTATTVTGNATCDGGNDGTITLTATGGTLPYQYSANGATFQATNILNVAPGLFSSVTIKDANGCTFAVPVITVGLTNNLTLTPATDPAPVCEGSSVQLQLTTNATQFAWTPAGTLSNTTIANPVAKPATSTLYSVIATLGRCSLPDDILVTVIPAPIPDAGVNGDICYGQTFQLQAVGDPTYTYTWTPATYLSSSTGRSPVSTPDKTTIYTLSVTDANGCPSLKTDQVTVFVTPPIAVKTYPADTVVYAGAQVPLLATSVGTSYVWSPAAGLDNSNIPNPVATAPVIEGAVVIYHVTTSTSAGCQGDAFVIVRVYKGPDIYVASAFSPNGDGKNDLFIPFPVGIKQLNYFRVFNRWGQLLYSTATLNQGWDGRLSGVEQGNGVYVWMAEGVTMDNKVIKKKGTVTLIR